MLWAQEMSSFLKGRRLWRYATGDIHQPTRKPDEEEEKFNNRLNEWDAKNRQILTWIRKTTLPSIKIQFVRYMTAKEVWDLM